MWSSELQSWLKEMNNLIIISRLEKRDYVTSGAKSRAKTTNSHEDFISDLEDIQINCTLHSNQGHCLVAWSFSPLSCHGEGNSPSPGSDSIASSQVHHSNRLV